MTTPTEHRVRDLRADRRALRAEQARVGWWRRIVRARIDLAVASAARPEALGIEDVPFSTAFDAPAFTDLDGALDGIDRPGEMARLERLRSLDERLAHYARGVEDALARTTDDLIERLAHSPATTVAVLHEPFSRS